MKHRTLPFLVAFTAVLLLLLSLISPPPPARASGIVYVNHAATGNNSGTSWLDAYTSLQTALANAENDEASQIWVATGVYTPGTAVDDSFQLVSGLAIYGGFAGNEASLSARNWRTNPTVLSGDLQGDDLVDSRGVVTTTAHLVGTNSRHVVTAEGVNNTASLDGFIITAGHATSLNGLCPASCGGGLYLSASQPNLNNLVVQGNAADYGGGLYLTAESHPSLRQLSIQGNSAQRNGGGLLLTLNSAPILSNVLVSGNVAMFSGGGIYNATTNQGQRPQLLNVTVSGNWAGGLGGGMANRQGSRPIVANSIFSGNEDESGLGTLSANLSNAQESLPRVRYSLVQGSRNSSGQWLTSAGVNHGFNLDEDPLFESPVLPSAVSTSAGNYQLNVLSFAIDAGQNSANNQPQDLAGNNRIRNGVIDMGAYEAAPATVGRVVLAGTGAANGRVTSTPAGIACPPTCAAVFTNGVTITLTSELVGPETVFQGWDGLCTGTGNCQIALNGRQSVVATYTLNQYPLTITKTGAGAGRVTSTPVGLNCGATCTALFDFGLEVALYPTAEAGFAFRGWGGACSGLAVPCMVTIEANNAVTAQFGYPLLYLPFIAR